jgi:hypothetical protein
MASSVINSDDGVISGTAGLKSVGGDDGVLNIQNNGTTAVSVASDGDVGVGTTSPGAKLDVFRASTNTAAFDEPQVRAVNSATATANQRVDYAMRWQDGTYNGIGGISMIRESATARSGALAFSPIASDGNGTERARIDSSGNLLVGTTSTNSSRLNVVKGDTTGPVIRAGATSGSFTGALFEGYGTRTTTNGSYSLILVLNGNGSGEFKVLDSGNAQNTNNSYGSLSDVKLKQDIVDAGSQWDDIKGLRVRKFRWKSDPDGFMQIGLVAQEAEEVSPGLIDESSDFEEVEVTDEEGNVTTERQATGTTTKAVKYSVLYMKAVKALQEAMERIETLEAKNDALEARLSALEQA